MCEVFGRCGIWGVVQEADRALGNRAQGDAVVTGDEDLAATHGLGARGGHDLGHGPELGAAGRPDVLERQAAGRHGRPEHRTAGEGDRAVGDVRDDAAVDQPVLLGERRAHRHRQLGVAGAELDQLGTQQPTERLEAEDRECLHEGRERRVDRVPSHDSIAHRSVVLGQPLGQPSHRGVRGLVGTGEVLGARDVDPGDVSAPLPVAPGQLAA